MKKITKYHSYNNGTQSRMTIVFEDGSQMVRRIQAFDAVRIAKEGRAVLPEMMEKYAEPQPRRQNTQSYDIAREAELLNIQKVRPLSFEEIEELNQITSKYSY